MDSLLSDSTLGIPKEVLAILAAIDGKPYSKAVWTLAKHRTGYSLKLFWGVEQKSAPRFPNSAHPTFSGRSNRNRRRLETFLVKKRAESSTQHSQSESPGTCKFSSVPKTSSDALVCLKVTSGHDSESSSHYHDQSCTMAESTSLKEPVNKAIDTVTNSAISLKLTQVDASSTGGHESVGPPTLVSSDDGVSASQGLPTSKVLHIDCPVSSRTRSKVIQHRSLQDLGNDSTTVLPSNSKPSVSNAKPPSVEPRNNLELVLPASLQGVTQHHMDFIRCDDLDTANTVKELMQQQWSELVKPGCRVKVTIMDKFVDAVVERTHFISKLSFDCCYFFATAKAEVKVSGSDSTRMFQFRDLTFQ